MTKDMKLPPRIQKSDEVPKLTACVGEAYKYSESGKPMTRGDRPLTYKLGREVAGQSVGAPSGMAVEPQTGEVTWTPQGEQVGEQQVSVLASNSAGLDAIDFTVKVDWCGREPQPQIAPKPGCCQSGPGGLLLALAGLAMLAWRRAASSSS